MPSTRYAIVSFLGNCPALFDLYYRRHPRFSKLLVRRDTDIVIEGYPRSANSFAVLAFEHAQPAPVRIAHHLHAPAQIELGVRYGIPILVLLREPIGAAASLVTRHPEVSVRQALAQYISFHESVRAHAPKVLVAAFESVTRNFGPVIQAVNERFGTSFQPYENSPERDALVFKDIDGLNRDTEGGRANQLARPSASKSPLLEEARAKVGSSPLAPRALEVFSDLERQCV